MTWAILLLIALVLLAEASSHEKIQSVEEQQWLQKRDQVRELELKHEKELGSRVHHDTRSFTFIAPLAPAFLMAAILVVYWLYLTIRSHKRSHFN